MHSSSSITIVKDLIPCSSDLVLKSQPSRCWAIHEDQIREVMDCTNLSVELSRLTLVYANIINIQDILRNELIIDTHCTAKTCLMTEGMYQLNLAEILCGPHDCMSISISNTTTHGRNIEYASPRNYEPFTALFTKVIPSLRELNMSHCAIDDEGVKIIVEMLPCLTQLDLSGNTVISKNGIGYLQDLSQLSILSIRGITSHGRICNKNSLYDNNSAIDLNNCTQLLDIRNLKILDISSNWINQYDNVSQSFISLARKLDTLIIHGGLEISSGVISEWSMHEEWMRARDYAITNEQLQYLRIQAPKTTIVSNIEQWTTNTVD